MKTYLLTVAKAAENLPANPNVKAAVQAIVPTSTSSTCSTRNSKIVTAAQTRRSAARRLVVAAATSARKSVLAVNVGNAKRIQFVCLRYTKNATPSCRTSTRS